MWWWVLIGGGVKGVLGMEGTVPSRVLGWCEVHRYGGAAVCSAVCGAVCGA